MCTAVVFDANVLGELVKPEFSLLHEWLSKGHGVLIYTDTGKYAQEVGKNGRMLKLLGEYRRAQVVRQITADAVRKANDTFNPTALKSGKKDQHILALAKAGDATILYSKDQPLGEDFRNQELLPKVGRRDRAIYPAKQPKSRRRKFLEARKCRKRVEGA